MPSLAHEALAVRLRERPELLSLLLSTLHKPTPTEPLAVNDSALRLVKPIEIRPDLVLANGDEGPWVLVEIQNEPDPVKKRKWPLAAAMMQDARGEMGDIVVITSSRATALWAESASFSRGQLGSMLDFRPTVVLLSDDEAEKLLSEEHPELGVFAAFAMHERYGDKAKRIITRALQLAERLPKPLQTGQFWAIFGVLSEPMRAWLEEVAVNPQTMEQDEEFQRWWKAINTRVTRAEEDALARGEARGEAQALLAVLSARGLAPDEATVAHIAACTDKSLLERWIVRAATANALQEVFSEP